MADDDRLSIEETAERFGVHPQTIRKRLGAGDLPGSTKDRRGRWMLDPDEVADVTGWRAVVDPAVHPQAARVEPGSTSGLVPFDQLVPLLERVSNAERDRADADARARIAEHERDRLVEARAPWPWWALAALVAAGAIIGAALAVLALG